MRLIKIVPFLLLASVLTLVACGESNEHTCPTSEEQKYMDRMETAIDSVYDAWHEFSPFVEQYSLDPAATYPDKWYNDFLDAREEMETTSEHVFDVAKIDWEVSQNNTALRQRQNTLGEYGWFAQYAAQHYLLAAGQIYDGIYFEDIPTVQEGLDMLKAGATEMVRAKSAVEGFEDYYCTGFGAYLP